MRFLILSLYLVGISGALAQSRMAPLPKLIILYGTDSSPVIVVSTASEGWAENYTAQQSVVTNLSLTCMSVNSVAVKREQRVVRLALRGAIVFGPRVVAGNYGQDQRLQKAVVEEVSLDLLPSDKVQVNDEIFPAARLAEKFDKIPAVRKKD